MSVEYRKDFSITVTNFFLYVVGFWFAANPRQEWYRRVTILYTILMIFFVMWLQLRGIYFSWGDLEVCIYMVCNSLALVLDLVKIFAVFVYKKKFLNLMLYMHKNFLHYNYDRYENSIVVEVKRLCVYFIGTFSFLSQSTVFSYIFKPLVSNFGRNETEREHIYNMWINIPVSVTPYYEVIYLIQALSVYQVGACYFCFENIFWIMCLHVAAQFRILHYRFSNILKSNKMEKHNENAGIDELYTSEQYYVKFKSCVQQHQALIQFCDTLEEVYTVVILGQVLMLSILICFIGYPVFLMKLTLASRIAFISFLTTIVCQLWMFTYSCDYVTKESVTITEAAYSGPWINLPMDKFGKMIRNDLQIIILRSKRPCTLTACGFFSISLETYTKVMSTAMSYFTLLKQSGEEAAAK